MSDLVDRLKSSIGQINDSYEVAVRDLKSEVTGLAEAVSTISEDKIMVQFARSTVYETQELSIYLLTLYARIPNGRYDVLYFTLESNGYPIKVSLKPPMGEIGYERLIDNKQSLTKYFEELVAASSSVLVLRLSHMLRRISDQA